MLAGGVLRRVTNTEPASLTALARRLSSLDPAAVAVALEVRRPRSVGIKDAFDLAQELLSSDCIDNGLSRFTATDVVKLASGAPERKIVNRCEHLLLAADGQIFPDVVARARYWIAEKGIMPLPTEVMTLSTKEPGGSSTRNEASISDGLVNVLLLNDLLAILEENGVRTTRTGHLSKASLLDVSGRLPHAEMLPADLVSWGLTSGLIDDLDGMIRPRRDVAVKWRELGTSDKWLWLAKRAMGLLSPEARLVLASCRGDLGLLAQVAHATYPIDSSWLSPALNTVLGALRALGLASDSRLSLEAQEAIDAGTDARLASAIREKAPTEVSTFLVQQDLSIVAPGLLTADVGRRLDTIARIESRGLASTYRLTVDSLNRALDSGETGAGITDFLADHSLTPIPQNVQYLISDTADRHGSIMLRRDAQGTSLSTYTPHLLDSLLVDSNLRALKLERVAHTEARTRVDADTVLRLAEDAGYPRPLVLTSPTRTPPVTTAAPAANPWVELVRRIQSETDDAPRGWMGRQLELAVRSKQRIRVTVAMPDGERDFVLDPAALANGRLRGRDVRGAVERTLPVDFIIAVGPAE